MNLRKLPRTSLLSLVLFFVGLVILYFYLQQVGVQNIADTIAGADAAFLALGFLISFATLVFFSLTWDAIVRSFRMQIPFGEMLKMNIAGVFVNMAVPLGGIPGEAYRAYQSHRRYDMPLGAAISAAALHRIFLFLPFIAGGVISLISAVFIYPIPTWIILVIALTLGVAVVILVALFGFVSGAFALRGVVTRLISFTVPFLGEQRAVKMKNYSNETLDTLQVWMKTLTSSRRHTSLTLTYAFLGWITEFLVTYVAFLSLRTDPGLLAIILVYSISVLLKMIPLGIPGMVGVMETVMTYLYNTAGIPLTLAASATMLTRVLTFWFPTTLGLTTLILMVKRKRRNSPQNVSSDIQMSCHSSKTSTI